MFVKPISTPWKTAWQEGSRDSEAAEVKRPVLQARKQVPTSSV